MENKLRYYRQLRGLTQTALAAQAHVPQGTISEIEDGKRTPGVDIAIRLAKCLGAAVEEIFGK